MSIAAYPLQWPSGWPRSHDLQVKTGRFGVRRSSPGSSFAQLKEITVSEASSRVLLELESMDVDRQDVVISTNLRLRLDGRPRSGESEPNDSGAAVYWETDKGDRRVMAIDRYRTVAANLAAIAAIAATLNAMRAIERHGGAQILDRAFTGFVALPSEIKREWWDVLECARDASPEVIKAQYRRLASDHHPDRGGDADRMAEINKAYQEATA